MTHIRQRSIEWITSYVSAQSIPASNHTDTSAATTDHLNGARNNVEQPYLESYSRGLVIHTAHLHQMSVMHLDHGYLTWFKKHSMNATPSASHVQILQRSVRAEEVWGHLGQLIAC